MTREGKIRRLLKPEQVGERLAVSLQKLKEMRLAGTGPRFVRLGHKTVRYPEDAVAAWLENLVETQS